MRAYSYIRHIIIVIATCMITISANSQHFSEFEFYDSAPANTIRAMQNNANAVFRQIHDSHFNRRQSINLSRTNATQEAIANIQSLWSTSQFYCQVPDLMRPVLRKPNGGWQIRGIPVFFVAGATPEERNLELVLEFTSAGLIDDVYIALPEHQYENFFIGATEVTDLRRRQMILGFVENFRTAYNRKDAVYIDRVFSSDALIITGRELTPQGGDLRPAGGQRQYEYITHNKQQYMERLRTVFRNNNFINVRFDEIEVMRHGGNPNIYGVTLQQHWNSSTYRDQGWLFLMIDFTDESNPLIWVRTWQALADMPFGLDNFIIRN